MSEPIRAIFLDAAGTLIHLVEPVGDTYARFATAYGVQVRGEEMNAGFRAAWKSTPDKLHPGPSPDDDRSWWFQLVDKAFTHACGHPIEPAVLQPLFAELYAHFAQSTAWQCYPDTLPALDSLHAKTPLFVLSNFDRRLLAVLEGLKLLPYFQGVILSSETGASKPHPRIFQRALDLAEAPAAQCLHIGDDPRCDLEGAQAMGMQTFLVDRPRVTLADVVTALDIQPQGR